VNYTEWVDKVFTALVPVKQFPGPAMAAIVGLDGERPDASEINSACYRALTDLEVMGLVEQDPTSSWRGSWRTTENAKRIGNEGATIAEEFRSEAESIKSDLVQRERDFLCALIEWCRKQPQRTEYFPPATWTAADAFSHLQWRWRPRLDEPQAESVIRGLRAKRTLGALMNPHGSHYLIWPRYLGFLVFEPSD
jgi:hypothetical protein